MPEETKDTNQNASPASPQAGAPAGGEKPPAGKPAAPAAGGAPPAKPAAAAPAKPAGPVPVPWESEMVARLKGRFGSGVGAKTYLGQNYVVADRAIVYELLQTMRGEEQFDYCVDVTAVHYPQRKGQEFDIVWILYSFPRNERVRVKTLIADGATAPTVTGLWTTANWLERECYDMFGVQFEGHPDLRRILLPDGWKGYPLRKEYGITQQDQEWVKINLGIESGR